MLYETIFSRKSVRKYTKDDIEENVLNKIKGFIDNVIPLFEHVGYEIKILGKGEVTNNWAPRYIAIYSEKKNGYLLNAGYLLQQVDLYVQSIGLGSCWIGLARPHPTKNKYGFIIMLSVGYPLEDKKRELGEFKRKELKEITNFEDAEIMEPVRLAPSADNSQPWYYLKTNESIDLYRNKKGFHALALNHWNQLDMGISLLHFELSLRHHNKKFEYFKKLSVEKLNGFEYVLSVKIH